MRGLSSRCYFEILKRFLCFFINESMNSEQTVPRRPQRNSDEEHIGMDGMAMDDMAIGSHLEIQVEAKNLANMDVFSLSDPFALLETWDNRKWVELGKCFLRTLF